MQIFFGVLLILIAVLLALDVHFLKKMSKSDIVRTRNLSDERYAELRIRQRIIEIGAAIVLFVGTFLGVFSLGKIQENFEKELNKRIETQKIIMDSLELKLAGNQEALKYTTKVYVIGNLKYPTREPKSVSRKDAFTIRFEDLITIHGERLPKFKTRPMIALQGKNIELDIADLTTEYVKIGSGMRLIYAEDQEDQEFYYFDMWIAAGN